MTRVELDPGSLPRVFACGSCGVMTYQILLTIVDHKPGLHRRGSWSEPLQWREREQRDCSTGREHLCAAVLQARAEYADGG